MNVACIDSLPHNWPFVYFHDETEALVQDHSGWPDGPAPDLVSGEVPLESVPDGRHPVKVYGKDAILFLWTSGLADFIVGSKHPTKQEIDAAKARGEYLGDLFFETVKRPSRHGLIVFEDSSSYDYAAQQYAEKSAHL